MTHDSHLILHHLDDPIRLLYWTMDEAAVVIVPPFMGLALERPLFGLLVSALSFWVLKHLKKRFGVMTLRHALYWYFPHNTAKLPHTPPSYIREWAA